MDLSTLKPVAGSRKAATRKARGFGGKGKTAGRGQKGQKAREGKKLRLSFEGGQMPLMRRMPKRGFNNFSRKEFAIVNLDMLNKFDDGATVSAASLVDAGLIKKELSGVKVLASGKLEKKLTIQVSKASKAAQTAIAQAGSTLVFTSAQDDSEN
ncbi:50S ribosomal protein L15 [Oenococcus kitaharae]|uniref:Large ribosomal subunit protein uL15 n=1 Tax=Oenococcus kitaharae DSM 17330 TaxID=1045004 RepID=G9WFJ5_9LACO|nr:50S ribosomal protein L15 [Oenococcus kitaharae]EHN59152.1 LSU ribosomal protein L15p (L27Ae) [Oenococcus kitaharae DSM 17330]OEY81970.1 50S ribosomal protein L15 [Oenococcus kitaharae]OEY82341.1 50S ribosomal protein L15 [Oenococcus kitaharae]OEY82747.1 50S ribosomal protein L15 [Oenococcus kitaharae]